MSDIDYAKILKAYMSVVVHREGTDFLGSKGQRECLDGLSEEENEALTRLRDEARLEDGEWPDYAPATPQGER